ncbi:unnamed protein product, partial [Penicillium salamii]
VSLSQVEYPDRLADYEFLSHDTTHKPLTLDQSISQQTPDPVAQSILSTSDFQTPSTFDAPITLERISPRPKKLWVLYTKINKTQFIK